MNLHERIVAAVAGLLLAFSAWGIWDAFAQTAPPPQPCASTQTVLDAYASQVARLQVQLMEAQNDLAAARKAAPKPEPPK